MDVFCAQQSCILVCKGCFRFMVYWLFFVFGGKKDIKKMKQLSKEEVEQLLIDSLVNNDTIETDELNERAEKVDKYGDAANIIKEYEEIFVRKGKVLYLLHTIRGKCSATFLKRKSL